MPERARTPQINYAGVMGYFGNKEENGETRAVIPAGFTHENGGYLPNF